MGLDMYLYGREETYNSMVRNRPTQDGYEVVSSSIALELAYWRKHWELHELITSGDWFDQFNSFHDCNGQTVHLDSAYYTKPEERKQNLFGKDISGFIDELKNGRQMMDPYPDPSKDTAVVNGEYIREWTRALEWMIDAPQGKDRYLEYYSSW